MKIDNADAMKMYSPEYVSKVAQANKKAEAENTTQDKTVYDDVDISKEGKSLLVTGKEKAERFRQQIHFCTFGDIKEIPAEYEMQVIKDEIKNATGVIDSLNDQEGYRGTSFESVALLQASKSYLENLKSTIIPEELREGFQGMIDEYAHFNETSRNSLMKRMTPDYMVVGIGNNTVSYKYKNEIVQSEQNFYNKESKDISSKFANYYSGGMGKEALMKDFRNYVTSFYDEHGSSVGSKAAINTNVENLLRKLAGLIR